ncbi:MAG: ABC transporter permease [Eubacteriaceae bacterium]|nr:ABC transporter permease [Eubacteriaceae bacterium]
MPSFLGACEVFLTDGFMYSVLALGFYISYSILDFPDLSVEGTALLGGMSYALLVRASYNPWLTVLVAFMLGSIAGCVTGFLHVKLKIRPLLCGILVNTMLITVNLIASVVGMGGNLRGEEALTTIPVGRQFITILRGFPSTLLPTDLGGINARKLIVLFVVATVCKLLIDLYLKTKNGLALRATGNNEQFVTTLGIDPGSSKIIGLAISNGLAAVTGTLVVTSRGNANQNMGLGMVVIGLASVIIGLSVFNKAYFFKDTTKVIFGSVIYQACLSFATYLGVPSAYNKLLMALLFTVALVTSNFTTKHRSDSRD